MISTASLINKELELVNSWLNANKICVNGDKTKYILFSYKKTTQLPQIKIGLNCIQETKSTKFLGVIFDKHLTFEDHITLISSKMAKSIGIIYKLNRFLPQNVLKRLLLSLIQPYYTYGIEAWYGTSKNLTDKIFILQKKSIRAVNCLPYNAHTNDYFKSMQILKLEDQFKLQTAQYIFKTLYLKNDEELNENLYKHSDIHNYNTRNASGFSIPRYNKTKSQYKIDFSGVKIWNSLPSSIKNSRNISDFSRKLKKNILNSY